MNNDSIRGAFEPQDVKGIHKRPEETEIDTHAYEVMIHLPRFR